MADKSVSALPAASAITGSDLFVLEQGGTAKKLAGSILKTYAEDAGEARVSEYVQSAIDAAESASASAQTATAKASEASSSAQTAATKASEASSSAQTASTKASEASTSASNAASSASSASTSAQTATAKASEAANSASSASTSAQTATTKASEAADSASSASTSAQTATTKASQAMSHEVNANAAKLDAEFSASQAAASQTAAANSASAAATSEANAAESEENAEYWAHQAEGAVAGVSSFKGRSGAVTPQSGDYTAAMVGALPVPYQTTEEANVVIYDASGDVLLSDPFPNDTDYYLNGAGTWTYVYDVILDTKNTAGATDTSTKIFLIGAPSQAANPQTYSDNEVYVTNGVLTAKSYSGGATLSGTPTAPTAAAGTNSTQIATTAFVKAAIDSAIAAAIAATY